MPVVPPPGLVVGGPRVLSPLERDAFNLVFWNSINPWDINLTIAEEDTPGSASGYTGNGDVRIDAADFQYADALHINSTLADTDIFKPGNMQYLCTLIHECTHHWQSTHQRFNYRGPDVDASYIFTPQMLEDLDLYSERYAAAAQIWFLIGWQLRYHTAGNPVDLTHSHPNPVGPTFRYTRIRNIPHVNARRIVGPALALDLQDDFSVYLNDLRFNP